MIKCGRNTKIDGNPTRGKGMEEEEVVIKVVIIIISSLFSIFKKTMLKNYVEWNEKLSLLWSCSIEWTLSVLALVYILQKWIYLFFVQSKSSIKVVLIEI